MVIRNNKNKYCDHHGVNRLLEELVPLMERHGIQFTAQMELMFSPIDDAVVEAVRVALENAIAACDALPADADKRIRLRAVSYPDWALSINNTCVQPVKCDQQGYPLHANGCRGRRTGDLMDMLTAQHMRVSCYMLEEEFCLLMQFPH